MRVSIAGKVCFILLIIFSTVLLAITSLQSQREQQQLVHNARQLADQALEAYFHRLDLVLLAHDHADQLTALPTSQTNWHPVLYAAPDGKPLPPAMARTLNMLPADQSVHTIPLGLNQTTGQHSLTITRPYFLNPLLAQLGCEVCRSLPANSLLGIARIDVPLTRDLHQMETHVLSTAVLLCLLFGAGVLMALYIIRRQVVAPLQRISLAMERASDLGDHTIRLPIERNDELTRLSENFNQLMDSLAQHPDSPAR